MPVLFYAAISRSLLSQPPSEERAHTWLELLAAMGHELGYKSLTHVDLDKFYIPQGHFDEEEHRRKILAELLRVLEGTNAFVAVHRKAGEMQAAQAAQAAQPAPVSPVQGQLPKP